MKPANPFIAPLLTAVSPLLGAIAFSGGSVAAAADLGVTIVDADTRQPVPARVRVRDAQGKDHLPGGAQVVRIGDQDKWFVSDGRSRLSVPAGRIEVRIERGTEYRPIKQTIETADDKDNTHAFRLIRWINMRKLGYVCGENHLHVSPQELGSQLAAEGLDFGTSLQWWYRPVYKVPPGEGFIRQLTFAGRITPTSVFDYELEHTWGAVYVLGQPEPLNIKDDWSCANFPIIHNSHKAGALVCYQGGWSREVLLDALLGHVDMVNVCNNNFHRHMFQPRSRYSNLLDVKGFPIYPDDPVGMMRMNTDTYYRLLNCGLRLAAGAGSATGAKRTPVGYNRAYVRAGDDPTLRQFYEAWGAGRNFVTNGPMIFLTVNDRHKPGDTIQLGPQGGSVGINVEALSDQPLTTLEVVINGQVKGQAPDLAGKARLSMSTPIQEGSWIAARCTAEDKLLSDQELAAYDAGPDKDLYKPCRLRFAHTGPIYVTVGGKSARVPASVAEAKRMLDAFEVFTNNTAKGDHRREVLDAVKDARCRLGD